VWLALSRRGRQLRCVGHRPSLAVADVHADASVATAFGMGLVFPTTSVVVTSGVGPGERALAGGLFVTAQQVGQAIGLAALATVATAVTNSRHGSLVDGYKTAFLVSIGISIVAVLTVAIQMRTPGTRKVGTG
jgi:hypothetical protein